MQVLDPVPTYTMSSGSYFRRPRHGPEGRATTWNLPGSRDAEAVVFVKPQSVLVEGFDARCGSL